MSGINDVWKAVSVFWRNGCAVLSPALFCLHASVCVCVCVSFYFLIVFYLPCRLTWDVALLFAPMLWSAWRHIQAQEMWKVWSYFSWDCSRRSKNEPHEQQTPPSLAQPRLHKACISSTQRQCLLSEVTARPETPPPQLSDHLIWLVSFLHPPLFLYFSSLSLCLFVCLNWKKETYVPVWGRHIKHKLFLVKGWALFQGQSETLSGR